MFLPYFDVMCDFLLNKSTVTWNTFVLYDKKSKVNVVSSESSNYVSVLWWIKCRNQSKYMHDLTYHIYHCVQCWRNLLNTVNFLLTDTHVSRQFYLWTLFKLSFLPPSQTLYLYIPIGGHSLIGGHTHLKNWKLDFLLFTLSCKGILHG